MALRMVVNDEQGELDRLLEMAPGLVEAGGSIVIISFMSLEDRKVKERFRDWGREGTRRGSDKASGDAHRKGSLTKTRRRAAPSCGRVAMK